MSTVTPSDRPAPDLVGTPASAPSQSELSSVLPREIERLANLIFAQSPGGGAAGGSPFSGTEALPTAVDPSAVPAPAMKTAEPIIKPPFAPIGGPFGGANSPGAVLPPSRLGPSALNVGSGGASPSVMLPPVPGAIKDPPLANAPPPRESDLRGVTAIFAENVAGTSAVPLLTSVENTPSELPYFLQNAGLPGAPSGAPSATPPGGGVGPSQSAGGFMPSQPQGFGSALPGSFPTSGSSQPYFVPLQGTGAPTPGSRNGSDARTHVIPDNATAPSYESAETRTPVLSSAPDARSDTRIPRDTYSAPGHTQPGHSTQHGSITPSANTAPQRNSADHNAHGGNRHGHNGTHGHNVQHTPQHGTDGVVPSALTTPGHARDGGANPSSAHGPEQRPTHDDYFNSNERLRYDVAEFGLHHEGPQNQAGRAPAYSNAGEGYVPNLSYAREAEHKPAPRPFDPYAIKADFPILNERVHGKRLVWLDNAATTQKPQAVIDRLSYFYEHENSNIHRAAHSLAARATDAYEGAREKVARFINAGSSKEIVFTRGTTESINLVAKAWGGKNLSAGDEVLITWLEHHANIVPWQMICAEKGAKLRVAPVDDSGQVILSEYAKLLNPRTKMVSITQVSNALGTITPATAMVQMARTVGATTLVDGAQAVSHMRADVQAIGCDFYVFSGHKVFGPTGIGALYGTPEALEALPAWQGGGNMIADVTFEKTVYNPPPWRFEAGTGNIADAVGLGAAIDYVESIGIDNVSAYEHSLLEYGTHHLTQIPGLRMIGTAAEKAGVMSFVVEGLNTEQMGGALDKYGIAVRSGHHCAQPILRRFGVEHTIRASLAPYNTVEDLDALVDAVRRLANGRGRRY
jgi:SufS family cysteine desulfurase